MSRRIEPPAWNPTPPLLPPPPPPPPQGGTIEHPLRQKEAEEAEAEAEAGDGGGGMGGRWRRRRGGGEGEMTLWCPMDPSPPPKGGRPAFDFVAWPCASLADPQRPQGFGRALPCNRAYFLHFRPEALPGDRIPEGTWGHGPDRGTSGRDSAVTAFRGGGTRPGLLGQTPAPHAAGPWALANLVRILPREVPSPGQRQQENACTSQGHTDNTRTQRHVLLFPHANTFVTFLKTNNSPQTHFFRSASPFECQGEGRGGVFHEG